jgi:hypothetical protein
MTVIELPQGHYPDLTGMTLDDVMQMFRRDDEAFVAKYPHTKQFHYPRYRQREVADTATAPWAHEWYAVDADGRLQMHSAHYDSSD